MKKSLLAATAAITSALSHPARLRIINMLQSGELCACQITAVLGLASSTVSAHLKELRLAGLVSERKDGRWVHFGLSQDELAQRWIATSLSSIGDDPQDQADRRMVEELRELPVEDLCRFGYDEARRRVATPPKDSE